MGITEVFKSFVPAHKVRLGSRCSYGLTQAGKEKAETFGFEGPKWEVLSYLNDHGASTLNDICEDLHMKTERGKEILNRLISERYVTVVQ